jgi:tetratricopeptide (TPR) repeat protein
MKKLSVILLVLIFFSSIVTPAHSYTLIPEYLCEVGIKFYQEGRYAEALQEFDKALLLQANYKPALQYIRKIKELKSQRYSGDKNIEINIKPSRNKPILEKNIVMGEPSVRERKQRAKSAMASPKVATLFF